jgi:hypothetical protein
MCASAMNQEKMRVKGVKRKSAVRGVTFTKEALSWG